MTTLTIELTGDQVVALLEQLPPDERDTALSQLDKLKSTTAPTGRLEDYFAFLAPDDIRLKSTRIGIESVLLEYLHRAKTPEQIAEMFEPVSLEQVYATILYYLRHKETVTVYLNEYLEYTQRAQEAQAANPPPAADRIRQLIADRQTKQNDSAHAPVST